MILNIDEFEIQVYLKKIYNFRLVVKPDGNIYVSAPLYADVSEISEFVGKRLDWLKKTVEKINVPQKKSESQIADGKKVFIFGKERILNFVSAEKNGYELTDENFNVYSKNNVAEKIYENSLKIILTEKINYYLQKYKIGTGMECSSFTVKKMTSRWGSCNVKTHKMSFAIDLAMMPEFCLDYVVLHELCHTKVPNHGANFKTLLFTYKPEWKSVKEFMNKNRNLYI